MARFFKPRGGFVGKPAKALRVEDDGDTYYVMKQGDDQRTGYVSEDHRWMPSYRIAELENLVAGGSWVEVPDADADEGAVPISPNAAPEVQAAQQQLSSPPAPGSFRSKPAPPPAYVKPADQTNAPK
jgi:hypothetical protein